MRIHDQDKEQVRIALHSEEAGRLLADLKRHAEQLEDADDLIEALEEAGVEPLEEAAHHRLEFPNKEIRVRRVQPEQVTLARQEVVGM